MGAMNFFRALASAFVVAVMGAIMLAELGTAPQRGGVASSAFIATAANVTIDDLAHTFSHIFAVAVLFLIIGIVSLIIMEERPLRTTVLAVPATRETPPRAPRSSAVQRRGLSSRKTQTGGIMDRKSISIAVAIAAALFAANPARAQTIIDEWNKPNCRRRRSSSR